MVFFTAKFKLDTADGERRAAKRASFAAARKCAKRNENERNKERRQERRRHCLWEKAVRLIVPRPCSRGKEFFVGATRTLIVRAVIWSHARRTFRSGRCRALTPTRCVADALSFRAPTREHPKGSDGRIRLSRQEGTGQNVGLLRKVRSLPGVQGHST